MRTDQKDKRTKQDILKLLDRALENEERLAAKIQTLEKELAECQKKSADPGYELTDKALPASKVSFRIDYYRTAVKGPLKGVIQHLFSQEKRSFEGRGMEAIGDFMGKYVPAEKKTAISHKPVAEKTAVLSQPVAAPEPAAQNTAILSEPPVQKNSPPPQPAVAPALGRQRLLHRLKAEMSNETSNLPEVTITAQVTTQKQPVSPRLQRILAQMESSAGTEKKSSITAEPLEQPTLLTRLRASYLNSVAND